MLTNPPISYDMTFASASQFHVYLAWVNPQHSALCLNVKALVSTFNQEKALVGAFSVIVTTDGSFAALILSSTSIDNIFPDNKSIALPSKPSPKTAQAAQLGSAPADC